MFRLTLALSAAFLLTTAVQAEPPAKAAPVGTFDTKDWLRASTAPLAPGELDRLIAAHQARAGVKPAPRVSDERFLRRVYLDVIGRQPTPGEIQEFLRERGTDNRARVIDRLLASDEYAQHWAVYWRNVIASKVTDFKGLFGVRGFDVWLTEQFRANRDWGTITRALLTAGGEIDLSEPEKNGQAFFLATRFGMDAPTELAAETSRIFLGIQIQCAQCHDHPSDVWKRQQFHEFAAFFARTREFPVFDREKKRFTKVRLVSLPFAEHRMPSKDDAKRGTPMRPTFLDGKSPGLRLTDPQRRQALADAITAKDNPWFAAAFVNRVWGQFLGQSFYQPIDDLGPQKEAVMPEVLARLAGSFRGHGYDIKQLFRDILNSATYQRDVVVSEDHLLFAGRHPVRLDAETLYNVLTGTLGKFPTPPRMQGFGPFARFAGFAGQFKQEFGFDPSAKAEEIEGSIPQALLLMNNPMVNYRLRARGDNLLARVLKDYPDNRAALDMVYLHALARYPTEAERTRCTQHLARVGTRAEAFEDVLWALVNSTEFQTKR